jgi:hypothetical protein
MQARTRKSLASSVSSTQWEILDDSKGMNCVTFHLKVSV